MLLFNLHQYPSLECLETCKLSIKQQLSKFPVHDNQPSITVFSVAYLSNSWDVYVAIADFFHLT